MKTANIGDTVVVSDPKHMDSLFVHSFIGTVKHVEPSGDCRVMDQDGNVYSVSNDEIKQINPNYFNNSD